MLSDCQNKIDVQFLIADITLDCQMKTYNGWLAK